MSHFSCMVLVDKSKVDDLKCEVRRLLGPYNEHLEVDEYECACHCSERKEANGIADPNCRYCKGQGKYRTNYNPNSHWDYYQVCGNWPGWPARELNDDLVPFAYVTPDGQWHQIAIVGLCSVEEERKIYEDWHKQCNDARKTYGDSTIAVSIDCHV